MHLDAFRIGDMPLNGSRQSILCTNPPLRAIVKHNFSILVLIISMLAALQGTTIEPAYLTGAAYLRTMGIMNQVRDNTEQSRLGPHEPLAVLSLSST